MSGNTIQYNTIQYNTLSHIGTISKKYYAGDSRNKQFTNKEDTDIDKWRTGFDVIDTNKDGKLSAEEICNYRDKEVSSLLKEPLIYFNKNIFQNLTKLYLHHKDTQEYRQELAKKIQIITYNKSGLE